MESKRLMSPSRMLVIRMIWCFVRNTGVVSLVGSAAAMSASPRCSVVNWLIVLNSSSSFTLILTSCAYPSRLALVFPVFADIFNLLRSIYVIDSIIYKTKGHVYSTLVLCQSCYSAVARMFCPANEELATGCRSNHLGGGLAKLVR